MNEAVCTSQSTNILGKVWIQPFSLQLSVISRVDRALKPQYVNQYRRRNEFKPVVDLGKDGLYQPIPAQDMLHE